MASDPLYLWVGANLTVGPASHSVTAALDVEGTLNGNYDSSVTVAAPIPRPSITSLSPVSGPVGTQVTISGFLARSGGTVGNAFQVRLPDGRDLFAASSLKDAENK